ncbi:type III pantothenate kinase [Thiohalophilus sp.]|uniref:type III pantothenate kinase n=1 Tax=Thiohalophilus sp. TaxID=3028392 RepID=UPI002ACD2094|nr:type III pantothenate kinase [Thiohalophilus sp.]MDZ7661249.1 type III pantothenate kinase [Thiohalophilus sp.]
MQLLIDFGNTRIKWALLQEGELCFGDEAIYTEVELAPLFENWWIDLSAPASVLCASVAEQTCFAQLEQWCRQRWQLPVTLLQAVSRQQGVINAYAEAHTLGSDRWVALIAAHRLTDQHVGVIDCGSAITVDLLRADGVHQGGYIVPGLWMMQRCLLERTGQINTAPSLSDDLAPGDSSGSCISHGALRSVTALLDRLMVDLQSRYDNRLQWLLTGGDAAHIQAHLRQPGRLVPDLVLQGLACVAQE